MGELGTKSIPRAIVDCREPVDELELHAFGDASTQGVGVAVYSIVRQLSGVTQHLVAGKGRLAKHWPDHSSVGIGLSTYGHQSCNKREQRLAGTSKAQSIWMVRQLVCPTLDPW